MHISKVTLSALMVMALITVLSGNAYSAGWTTSTVKEVGVLYGNGCVLLNNGEIVQVDVDTSTGKAELSIALSAKVSGKQLSVYQTDEALQGGCNAGTSIKPHSMLKVLDL